MVAVGTIAMVNPDKARNVEMMLLQMAQQGKIREKISEAKIVSMLEQIGEAAAAVTVTTVGPRVDDLKGSAWDDGGEDPIAKVRTPSTEPLPALSTTVSSAGTAFSTAYAVTALRRVYAGNGYGGQNSR
eukprot:COSAG01_NODE_5278_length_4363_cov_175.868433_5_plen_129_part_00